MSKYSIVQCSELTLLSAKVSLNYMNGDFTELVEYLDKKFQNTASKEDINNLAVKLLPREEFDLFGKEIKQELKDIKENINNLTTSIDRLVKAINSLQQEYAAVVHKINRHEKWLHQVAEKVGIKLEY